MRPRFRLPSVALLLVLAACVPAGQLRPDAQDGLRRAEAARVAAMLAGDLPALAGALADELSYAHSNGSVQDKAALLAALGSHELAYRSFVAESLEVRAYGAAGVVTGVARLEVELNGAPRSLRLRYTATYVHRAGRWQLAAYQSTPLPAS